MTELKCKCPECGGSLTFWDEYCLTIYKKIKLDGTISKLLYKNVDELPPYGLTCNSCNKDWYGAEWEEGNYKNNPIGKIFEMVINKNNI